MNHVSKTKLVDDLDIVATAIGFLFAGYDTTGTALAYACYHLSKNPDVQEKLRNEILAIAGDDSDDLTYDQIQAIPYLDQVVHETLRFSNPVGLLSRATCKPYTIPGTDLTLEENFPVWINSIAVHMDPNIYPDPTKFNPDNFSKENKAKRHP